MKALPVRRDASGGFSYNRRGADRSTSSSFVKYHRPKPANKILNFYISAFRKLFSAQAVVDPLQRDIVAGQRFATCSVNLNVDLI